MTKNNPPCQLPVISQSASSPLKRIVGRSASALEHPNRVDHLLQVEASSHGKWLGPDPPTKFIETLLPQPDFVEVPRKNASPSSEEVIVEKHMYPKFVEAAAPFCPSYDVKVIDHAYDNVSWPGEEKKNLTEIDVSVYPKGITLDRKLDISRVEMFFEFSKDDSGFDDSGKRPFEKEAADSQKTRAQLATYASAIMATQFRTHVFCVEVTGHYARLIRFDREGAVVTSAFRYDTDTHLVDFLWRFNHATRENQGHDPSVKIPEPTDSNVEKARRVLNLAPQTVVWRFEVYDEANEQVLVFYGAISPLSMSLSPFGRCTRGLVVMDVHGNKVYLKDTWRIVRQGMVKEGDIYAKLHQSGVSHIPHVVAHGDASPGTSWQSTISLSLPSLVTTDEDSEYLRPFTHYFIVFREVGRPLVKFSTTWELVNSMKDAVAANQEAYAKARILHRDISAGNILISEDGKEGYLIDWDFSKEVADDIEIPRQPERTGTWQFMSATLLLGESSHHTRADDLESFFYVLCWVTLKLGPHRLPKAATAKLIQRWFDYAIAVDGVITGGENKWTGLKSREMRDDAKFLPGPLKDLIVDFEDLVAVRCEMPPSDEDRVQYARALKMFPPNDPFVVREPAHKYETKITRLEDWGWIYERFCRAMEDPAQLNDSPFDHAAQTVNVVTIGAGSGGSRKRTSDNSASTSKSSKKPRN
ncbi:other 1 protein kinase [Moniliophthora roreri]|nr:other 1 protein kinase [Moniliophthora roreri]